MKNAVRLSSACLLLAACAATPEASPRAAASTAERDEERARSAEHDDDELPLGRLPSFAQPLSYKLALTILPEEETFSGSVAIRVRLSKAREHLWLHGRGLRVKQAQATLADGRVLRIGYTQMTPDGVVRVDFPETVAAQEITLAFSYDASFSTELDGLYRLEHEGRRYVFTQMEPISARQCFPGFDEPAFKTPFDVTLTVREGHQAIANSAAVGVEKLEGGLERVHFARTEKIPTYLVAFAVGELDVVRAPPVPANAVRAAPLPLRGVAVKGKGHLLAHALHTTSALLGELETYFGIAYPFDKLDIIAVPDFSAGAMENVGAITFREWLLLVDPKSAPVQQLRANAYVTAHELAHMWFGNIVTMPWWDDLWLNEAFASWMAYRVVERWDPTLQGELTLLDDAVSAMKADSLASARQIRQPIESNHDILNAFDSITYDKGAGVLSMFEAFLGAEVFRRAVQLHLQRFRFGSATAADFLTSLSEASGRDVTGAFRSFLFQPGVPLVDVTLTCGAERSQLTMAQSRYLPIGSEGDSERQWELPVCVRYQVADATHEQCWLLDAPRATVTLAQPGCPAWLMPNAHGAGYYRFAMGSEDQAKLIAAMQRGRLGAREKLVFADSLQAAFAAGRAPAFEVLGALEPFVSAERLTAQWPMSLLREAREHLVEAALVPKVEAAARRLYAARWAEIGFAPKSVAREDHEVKLLRGELVRFLGLVAREPAVREEAVRRARAFVGFAGAKPDPSALDADVAEAALAIAVQDEGAAFFELVVKRFTETNEPVLRRQLAVALSQTNDPALAVRVRALALDPAVRTNEVYLLLAKLSEVPGNLEPTWRWLTENVDAVLDRLPEDWGGELPWLASGFCDEAKAREVEAFFAPRIDGLMGGPRSLQGALEDIRLCAARVKAQRASAERFFEVTGPSGPR